MRGSSVQFRQGACVLLFCLLQFSYVYGFDHFFGPRFFCLGRLMDGLQPSKLFCVGSSPIRDVMRTPVWRLPHFCGNTQYDVLHTALCVCKGTKT